MANHPNRRASKVEPPQPGTTAADDRDEACADALEPHISRLVSKAEAVGWARAEIVAAVLSLTVSEMRTKAGDRATRETLAQAIMLLDD